jgi:hypothetical protein
MKFGVIKSKIEKCLSESYKNKTFKKDIFIFNELVLKNKNVSKLYYLYEELSNKKELTESVANEFVNESIKLYENTVNKIPVKTINEINLWVSHVKTKNTYQDIDNLFSTDVVNLEEKIKSKKTILEGLKSKQEVLEEMDVSLKTLNNAAKTTLDKFISQLSESSQKELKNILTEEETKVKMKYEILKESVVEKLEELREDESDGETVNKINETIDKVSNEQFTRLNYFKLKQLHKNI